VTPGKKSPRYSDGSLQISILRRAHERIAIRYDIRDQPHVAVARGHDLTQMLTDIPDGLAEIVLPRLGSAIRPEEIDEAIPTSGAAGQTCEVCNQRGGLAGSYLAPPSPRLPARHRHSAERGQHKSRVLFHGRLDSVPM